MATVGNNIITTCLSRKLGNLIVFRNHRWKTVNPIHQATCQKENNRSLVKDEGLVSPLFSMKVEHKVRIK